jgi:8-amino-7-oxononanoate synthase
VNRPSPWHAWAEGEAAQVRGAGRWRSPRAFDATAADGTEGTVTVTDAAGNRTERAVVSFASNDYLGLTRHPAVIAAAHDAIDRWGTGSGAARLIVGSRPVHDELEHALAAWKRTERAVLFSTGFAANIGVLATFAGPDVLVVSDELNHASLIDGRRLADAPLAVYDHCDAAHVERLLLATDAPRALVVTESVFSMDGDVAPVDELAAVCARHGALLVVDEAHAVLGPDPDFADPSETGLDVLRVGTLSKTLGSLGGFVAGPQYFTDLLVNLARPYIFTTASTPADSAAALAAVGVLRSPEGRERRSRLRANIDRVRPGHPSPVIPFVCGSEAATLDAAAALLDEGILVTAIRPPTVAPGTSRLRVAISAVHGDEQLDHLAEVLRRLFPDDTAVTR